MDALILAAALVGLAAWVAAPLYAPAMANAATDRSALEARRDALVAHLRELRWDHEAGLLSHAEYERQRAAVEDEAARILRALDPDDRPESD